MPITKDSPFHVLIKNYAFVENQENRWTLLALIQFDYQIYNLESAFIMLLQWTFKTNPYSSIKHFLAFYTVNEMLYVTWDVTWDVTH